MSINLPYVEGTCEKLRRILGCHNIRSHFYAEKTLRKNLCKPRDRVATEDKRNIVYKIDCSNCESVYFGESNPVSNPGYPPIFWSGFLLIRLIPSYCTAD